MMQKQVSRMRRYVRCKNEVNLNLVNNGGVKEVRPQLYALLSVLDLGL